jgi:hypothetical protein
MNGYKAQLLRAKVPLMSKLTVGLYTNKPPISGALTLADLAEYAPLFGYKRASPAPWGLALVQADGRAMMQSAVMKWGPTTGGATAIFGTFGVDEFGNLALISPFLGLLPTVMGQEFGAQAERWQFYEDTMKF